MVHRSEEDFYGELNGLDWTDTPDWADLELAKVWRTSLNWTCNPKGPEDVTALIRKARADGVREGLSQYHNSFLAMPPPILGSKTPS